MKITEILVIALGGALGSVLRAFVGQIALGFFPAFGLYLGVALVNIVGCFFAGAIVAFLNPSGLSQRLLVVGFFGGLTTFSAYALDSQGLLAESGFSWAKLCYVLGIPLGSVFGAWLGFSLFRGR